MPFSFRWVVLGLTTVLQVGVSMPQQTPAAIGPIITRELGLSRAELGLLTSAIWGGMLLGMLPAGVLSDRYGERRVIAIGAGLTAVLVYAASYARGFATLFAILLLASLGAASAAPGGTKAIAAWFSPGRRALALGIRQTGVTIAGVVAAFLLPPIALWGHWPAALRTVGVIVLVAVVGFALFYREPPEREPPTAGRRFDFAALIRNRTFVIATTYAWIFMGALGCAVSYLGASVHEQAGLDPVKAGGILAALQVGGISGRIGWGLLFDRLRAPRLPMLLSGLLAIAACAAMALVRGPVAIPELVTLAFLLGLSTMGWNALYLTVLAEVVPVKSAATAIGTGLTISFVGMFVVPPVFGLIADLRASYADAWAVLAAWALVGTMVAVLLPGRPGAQRWLA